MGSSSGKQKRINEVILSLFNTVGGKVAANNTFDDMKSIQLRTVNNAMDQPLPLFTGEYSMFSNDGQVQDVTLTILQDQPLPFTMTDYIVEMMVYDRS